MEKKPDIRMMLGILLIVVAIFYKPGGILPVVNNKLEKPEAEIVALVEGVSVPNDADSSKLAGLFNALSEKLDETTLNSNLQVQYLMDYVGKNTFGSELMDNGKPKYPEFSPAVAAAMTKVLGPQTETNPITGDEKRRLARLFYGLSWKLYKPSADDEYESYKAKALATIAEYNNDEDPEPNPDEDDCPCEGKGYIIHGDGHRTDCPCVAAGRKCDCSGAAGATSSGCDCEDGCECAGGECECEKSVSPPTLPPTVAHNCQCVTSTTRCACVERYGQCSCPPVSAGSTSTSSGSSGRSSTSGRGLFGRLRGC